MRDEEHQRAREAQSQIHRRLAKFPHHQFSHGEGVREGRVILPLTVEQERNPALIAESVEFYELVIEWAKAGLRVAELRGRTGPNASQAALAPRSATELAEEGEDF